MQAEATETFLDHGRARRRTFHFVSGLAAVALWIAATTTPCDASSVALRPIPSTSSGNCPFFQQSMDCWANPGDTLSFAIVFDIGSEGVSSWNLDLAWESPYIHSYTGLDFVALNNSEGPLQFYNPSPPPISIFYSLGDSAVVQQSASGQEGHIFAVSTGQADVPALTAANVSFRAGTVTFEVISTMMTEISLGFFNTPAAMMKDSALQPITPDFGTVWVNTVSIPEPSTVLLLATALAGLAMRRRGH